VQGEQQCTGLDEPRHLLLGEFLHMTTQPRSSQQAMVTDHHGNKSQRLGRSLLMLGSLVCGLTGSGAMAQPPLPSQQVYRSPQATKLEPQSMEMLRVEAEIWHQINQQRQRYGLSPLRVNERLTQAARNYSKQMADHNFYSHTGLNGQTFRQRVEAQGIRAKLVGENLVKFSARPNPSQVAVASWMNSPGHRKNILLSQMTDTGIGIWKQGKTYYMTQLFVEPKASTTASAIGFPLN
jgi:uncharacterized protein YkwD